MANTTISALPSATTPLSGTEVVPIVQSGVTKKVAASDIAVSGGVKSFQTSLSGLTPSTATAGVVTLAGTLGTASGGTGLTSFTANGVVYASSSSALTTGSALTFDGTTLSSASVSYKGSTSGTVTLTAPAVAGTQSYTLPTAVPAANGYALTSTTAGVMSWAAAGGSPGGAPTQIQYNSSGSFAGSANLTTDGTNLAVNGNLTAGSGNTAADVIIKSSVGNGGAGFSEVLFANSASNTRGYVSYSHASDSILFGAASATRLTLNSNGALVLNGGSTSADGVGVTFPATQSASTNANTLDDYEEGTWTPTQGAGLTVVGAFSSNGQYTRIGNVVTVQASLFGATSIASSSAGILCGGLPFTPVPPTSGYVVGSLTNQGGNITNTSFCLSSASVYGAVAIAANSGIHLTITYRA